MALIARSRLSICCLKGKSLAAAAAEHPPMQKHWFRSSCSITLCSGEETAKCPPIRWHRNRSILVQPSIMIQFVPFPWHCFRALAIRCLNYTSLHISIPEKDMHSCCSYTRCHFDVRHDHHNQSFMLCFNWAHILIERKFTHRSRISNCLLRSLISATASDSPYSP